MRNEYWGCKINIDAIWQRKTTKENGWSIDHADNKNPKSKTSAEWHHNFSFVSSLITVNLNN